MRVVVHTELCTGHLRCLAIAEDLFRADDRGIAFVVNDGIVPEGREAAARLAFRNCPEHAITIEDDPDADRTDR
jgi:ferredoxin